MVAAEVLRPLARRRVGVKRSREQPVPPAAKSSQVRPALDADPVALTANPTMEAEGRGALHPSAPHRQPGQAPSFPPGLSLPHSGNSPITH